MPSERDIIMLCLLDLIFIIPGNSLVYDPFHILTAHINIKKQLY